MPEELQRRFFLWGQPFEAPPLAPGLYVVATPIGNLTDITLRALQTLAAADLILCEDTRHSARLLDHYGVKGRRKSLHEHNEREAVDWIAGLLAEGQVIALISDAGTPLLSDPGFPLVRALRERDLPVFAVPGPSALLAALASAGLPTDRFSFIGFLPAKAGAREGAIAALKGREDTLVFYESPRRLDACLAALRDGFGPDRDAVVALELTKKFERVARGTLEALATQFAQDDTKGEAVVLVAGAGAPAEPLEADWQDALAEAMAENSLREAVDMVSARFDLPRKKVYDAALKRKAEY